MAIFDIKPQAPAYWIFATGVINAGDGT